MLPIRPVFRVIRYVIRSDNGLGLPQLNLNYQKEVVNLGLFLQNYTANQCVRSTPLQPSCS